MWVFRPQECVVKLFLRRLCLKYWVLLCCCHVFLATLYVGDVSIQLSITWMHSNQFFFFLFLGVEWDWVHLVRRPLTALLYQPRMIDDECGADGGMRIGRGNQSSRRKSVPVPLCPPQIPHDLSSNPGRRGGKTASNRLSYGAAIAFKLKHFQHKLYQLT
jgi:hypothetical protein